MKDYHIINKLVTSHLLWVMNVTVTLDQQHHIATNERTIELSSSVSVVQICKYIYASYLKNRIGKLGG